MAMVLVVSWHGGATASALISPVTSWGTTGSGSGQLDLPTGIAVASNGNVYIGENDNHRIQVFDADGNFLSIFNNTDVTHPQGMAFDDSGNLWVADSATNSVKKFNASGTLLATYGSAGSGDGQFDAPSAIAVDSDGNFYVTDYGNTRVEKFDSSGAYVTQWGSSGAGDGQFSNPIGIAVDSDNDVYVSEDGNCRVQKFTSDGTFITKWGSMGSGDGQLFIPQQLAVDDSGNVYVTDSYNARLEKFSSSGVYLDKYTGPFNSIYNVAVNNAGSIYTVEYGGNQVQKLLDSEVTPPNTAPDAPVNLGPANLVDSSVITTNQPQMTFDLSDPNAGDTIKYTIQIDDTLDFSSPLVDYASSFAVAGSVSFTVGQPAGSGVYASGGAGQSLPDGWFYWRVKATDSQGASSSFVMAHGNAIAFTVDVNAPTTPGTPAPITPSTDLSPTWTWAPASDSGSGLAPTPYTVELSQDASFSSGVASTDVSSNSYTTNSVLATGTWYLRVKAKDAIGRVSAYSTPSSIALAPAPVSPPASSDRPSDGPAANNTPQTDATIGSSQDIDIPPLGQADVSSPLSKTIVLDNYTEFTEGDGKELRLEKGDMIHFTIDGLPHSATLKQVGADFAVLAFSDTVEDARLNTGQADDYDVTGDKKDDIRITLMSVDKTTAKLKFAQLAAAQASGQKDTVDTPSAVEPAGINWWLFAVGGVVAAVIALIARRLYVATRRNG